jgi:hypothetical protein
MLRRMTILSMMPLVSLVACSAEPGTGPAGQISMEAPFDKSSEEDGNIRLSSAGIRTTGPEGTQIAFGTSRELTEDAVTAALGQPQARNENLECGAGAMQFTSYSPGVILNFQNGNLVGWFAGEGARAPKVATPEGFGFYTPMDKLSSAYNVSPIEDSTLGDEFSTNEGIGFFSIDSRGGSVVASFYAGTNCFFR